MSESRSAYLKEAFLKRPLLFASVFAVAAALLASGYISRREGSLMRMAEPVEVVVARREIAAGERLDPYVLELRKVPRRFVASGAITRMKSAAGRVAIVPIPAGSQIQVSFARPPSAASGVAGQVPIGKRAFSIGVDTASAAGGLIRPDDSIDIMATFEIGGDGPARRTTFTVVQDAQVLAVGRRMAGTPEDEGGEGGRSIMKGFPRRSRVDEVTVTVAVAPSEAQELALAASSAKLAVSVRPLGDAEDIEGLEPATITSIAGDEGLLPFGKRFREYRGR